MLPQHLPDHYLSGVVAAKYVHLCPCNRSFVACTGATHFQRLEIGIVPSGAVVLISKLFTASVSDQELFEQSGLSKLLGVGSLKDSCSWQTEDLMLKIFLLLLVF